MASNRLTDKEIRKNRTTRLMNLVAKRCAYYRANPHRFVSEVLGINLKTFQKILIYAMMVYDNFYFIAARGLGKTYLVALFAVVRCILYPHTQIVAVSGTFKQGKEIILKITDDFMQKSPILRSEIKRFSTGQNECGVWFKNGSWIQVTVANDNARGKRANIIIIDEARMVKQNIVDTVIKPMAAAPRQCGYMKKPEYKHIQEMNKEMYMSSAWYTASEMYDKVKSYTASFLDDNVKYFICDLPYQLSIMEGLLMRQQIENEMNEATFSDISFMMEREGKFYGSAKDALFNFNVLNERRLLSEGLHPLDFYRNNSISIPKKAANEKRILSLDIALLASKKHDNDASCFILNQLFQTEDSDMSNISYIETQEGILTEDLGLMAMRYFYQYDCDFIAIDCSGIGQSTLDYIMKDRKDPVYGVTYKAMCCINNDDLNSRCKVRDANKVVYAIKANAQMNNDMCLNLRSGFQNGYIRLLFSENDMDDKWNTLVKGFKKLPTQTQTSLKMSYYQTSALIDELINLEHDTSSGRVKVKERSGMRKDRYSSLLYNYYVVDQIRVKYRKQKQIDNLADILPIRKGVRFSSF